MTSRSRFCGNTAFGLAGMGLFVAAMVVGHFFWQGTDQRVGLTIGFVGFGLGWLVVAGGQLVTGCAWQNLADRNEGPRRDENPKRFWGSVALDVAICIVSCAFALYNYYAK